MQHYPYLIIGGGMTADAAVRGIRELDATSPIGLIGAEKAPPYARPPLSKALWKGEPLGSVWLGTADLGVETHLGRTAKKLELDERRVTDDRGAVYTFEKLLLATGGTPRRLPIGGDSVIYFRTLDDYRRLRALADQGKTVAVLGGGFIGSEIAAALAMQGCSVTMLFPDDGIGARVFPPALAREMVNHYREKGVTVRPGELVTGLEQHGDRTLLETKSGLLVTVDAVVAGLGIEPNTDLAVKAGLQVADGIVVDDHLRTSHDHVFAAGDVACFKIPAFDHAIRVEHEDNARTMGRAAGRAMAGERSSYTHLPFFYSDLFELGYEAVGELDPLGEAVVDWKVPFREGVIYYLQNRRVRGVLLWNTWGQVEAARQLIAEPGPVTATALHGRLPA